MKQRTDLEFEVRWFPFQLNPQAPKEPANRMQMYMDKFGKGPDEVKAMAGWMQQKFTDVGLPYRFTEAAKVSNTIDAHKVLTAAYNAGGAQAQDRAVESIFHSYFAEELAPNDPVVLEKAAKAAGIEDVGKLLQDAEVVEQTKREFSLGRQMGVHAVPHFVLSNGSAKVEVSGAQPVEEFTRAIQRVAR